MCIVICPGIHSAELTAQFLAGIPNQFADLLVFPAHQYPAYSALHILEFLEQSLQPSGLGQHGKLTGKAPSPQFAALFSHSLLFVAFSAGVVGAIGAARLWLRAGGQVKAVIAIDGWGVPLYGDFPIHRISHDAFTHWSSAWLGAGQASFYADPAVEHLQLWRSPQTVEGWQIAAASPAVKNTSPQSNPPRSNPDSGDR
ncbi:MAG TPA: hypothetical protein V6C57_14835, partial [Coleofasciculaceae cyanobacterium]